MFDRKIWWSGYLREFNSVACYRLNYGWPDNCEMVLDSGGFFWGFDAEISNAVLCIKVTAYDEVTWTVV